MLSDMLSILLLNNSNMCVWPVNILLQQSAKDHLQEVFWSTESVVHCQCPNSVP